MAAAARSVRVGGYQIVSLPDAGGSFGTFSELFPAVPPAGWAPYRARYPELFDGDAWVVPFTSFLLRGPGATILVDTGLGPDGTREPDFMPDRQGWLPESLAEIEMNVADIDIVFLTHHHSDHIGWNVYKGGAAFPEARYITGTTAWRWTLENRTESYILDALVPLRHVTRLIESDTEIAPGVRAVETPGHYPGHMSLAIEWKGERAFLLGDIAVNPAQLSEPSWTYAFDMDPDEAIATRERVLTEFIDPDTVVVGGHFPNGGIGRLVDDDGTPRWTPI